MNTVIPKYMLEIALLGVAKKPFRRALECVYIKGNTISSCNNHIAISIIKLPSGYSYNGVDVLIPGASLTAALKAFTKEKEVTLSVSGSNGAPATLSGSNGAIMPLDTMDDSYPDLNLLKLGGFDGPKIAIVGAHLAVVAKVSAILAKYAIGTPDHCIISLREKGMVVNCGDVVEIYIAAFTK
ncbi:MAG: hypothetical protein IPG31_00030 [Nitrosomonas sp.]|nr:hypothetical protein [Nitrosomonas sp.]